MDEEDKEAKEVKQNQQDRDNSSGRSTPTVAARTGQDGSPRHRDASEYRQPSPSGRG